MSYCPTCGEFILYPSSHKCHPAWEAQDPDTRADDDWTTVYASDYEYAATAYAEKADCNGGDGASERVVHVRKPGSTDFKRFDISFDYSVNYYAHEVA